MVKTGLVKAKDMAKIVPEMIFELPRNVFKGEAMVMEMIKENNWKRPMYVCVTVGEEFYPKSLSKYLSRTGLVYQILPVGQQDSTRVNVNTEKMYNNMMTKFKFGGVENPKVYLDDQVMRMCKTHRIQFTYLAEALIAEGDTVKAKKVLEYVNKVIPASTVPHDYSSNMMALYYYELGMKAQGDAILDAVAKNSVEYLTWYAALKPSQQSNATNSIGHELAVLNQVLQLSSQADSKTIFDKYMKEFESFATKFNMR